MTGLPRRPRVVVIGTGFGGLEAVRELTEQHAFPMDITVVSPSTHFLVGLSQAFLMLGALEKMDVAIPIDSAKCFLPSDQGGPHAMHKVTRVRDAVSFVDWRRQTVCLRSGAGPLAYDYLVVASGAVCSRWGIPGLAHHSLDICSPEDNEMLSHSLESLARLAGPGRRKSVVVGVSRLPYRCPMAPLEWAMLIDARLRAYGVREHVDILYISPETQLVPMGGAVGNLFMSEVLRRRGINVQCGCSLVGVHDARELEAQHGVRLSSAKALRVRLNGTPPFVKAGCLEAGLWPSVPAPDALQTANPAALADAVAAATPLPAPDPPLNGAAAPLVVLAATDIFVSTSPLIAPSFVRSSFPTTPEHGSSRFLPACRVSQATQYPRIFAAGDVTDVRLRCSSPDGSTPLHPKTGHFAKQMAQTAAVNILSDIAVGGRLSCGVKQPQEAAKSPADPPQELATLSDGCGGEASNRGGAARPSVSAGRAGGAAFSEPRIPVTPPNAANVAMATVGGVPPSTLAPGWWWSGSRAPTVRWGVCAFQTDGVRAVAVRVNIPLEAGAPWRPGQRPCSPTSATATVSGGDNSDDEREPTGDGMSATPRALSRTPRKREPSADRPEPPARPKAGASSRAGSPAVPARAASRASSESSASGPARPAAAAGVSSFISTNGAAPLRASSLAAALAASSSQSSAMVLGRAAGAAGPALSSSSSAAAEDLPEVTYTFNMPTEAAMEYVLLFWRTHIHRWFLIPPDVCPPHLVMEVPSYLAGSSLGGSTAGGNSSGRGRAGDGAKSAAGSSAHSSPVGSTHSRDSGALMLQDATDVPSDEGLWQRLKQQIDLELSNGRSGDASVATVGTMLEGVASRTPINDVARMQLVSAVNRGFGLSSSGALTVEQAIAHGVHASRPPTTIMPNPLLAQAPRDGKRARSPGPASTGNAPAVTPLPPAWPGSNLGSTAADSRSGHSSGSADAASAAPPAKRPSRG
ncbi:hypothetical protein FNF27_03473 [Cafeteria roenbergensis]|uniref:FAD/NAD(P)-binding domain-containing protein n=1 Tax=Cafeteria roenbergensis TaxID=33653 RepID=A0A5A8EBG8_CAFRO|nr:hypothetical protein FNF27_03473 [Cafeteria roenbergensis]